MKNTKKLLACLLAGVMVLAMLTACGGGINAGVSVKGIGVLSEAECDKLGMGLAYNEDLCQQARKVANFLANNAPELKEEADRIVRVTTAMPNNDYSTITKLENKDLQNALEDYNCNLGFESLTFGIGYDVDAYSAQATFIVPKSGIVTDAMREAALGQKEIGAAYILTSNGTYIVTVFH